MSKIHDFFYPKGVWGGTKRFFEGNYLFDLQIFFEQGVLNMDIEYLEKSIVGLKAKGFYYQPSPLAQEACDYINDIIETIKNLKQSRIVHDGVGRVVDFIKTQGEYLIIKFLDQTAMVFEIEYIDGCPYVSQMRPSLDDKIRFGLVKSEPCNKLKELIKEIRKSQRLVQKYKRYLELKGEFER